MTKVRVLEVGDSSARVLIDFYLPSGKRKQLTRTIALREAQGGVYRGEVLLKDNVTGKFIWDWSRFAMPVFISNICKAKNGLPRRYVNNPINTAIAIAMRAIEGRVEQEAEMAEVA